MRNLLIACLVVLALGVIVGGVWYVNNNHDTEQVEIPTADSYVKRLGDHEAIFIDILPKGHYVFELRTQQTEFQRTLKVSVIGTAIDVHVIDSVEGSGKNEHLYISHHESFSAHYAEQPDGIAFADIELKPTTVDRDVYSDLENFIRKALIPYGEKLRAASHQERDAMQLDKGVYQGIDWVLKPVSGYATQPCRPKPDCKEE